MDYTKLEFVFNADWLKEDRSERYTQQKIIGTSQDATDHVKLNETGEQRERLETDISYDHLCSESVDQ